MTRTDGKFPAYGKVDLDYPADYYERSYGCVNCGTRWPHLTDFVPTPCCGIRGESNPNAPSMPWKEALYRLKESRFERCYEIWNDGVTDYDLSHAEFEETVQDDTLLEEAVNELIDFSLSERTRN